MSYLEGYQGQFGAISSKGIAAIVGGVIGGGPVGGYLAYKLIKATDQEPGTKYVKSGYPIKSRTRMPPDGRMTWVTPEDMGNIVITIVDGADTVLKKIQVFAVNQLKQSLPGAPTNAQYWDMRFIGWKGEGKGKSFKADPSRGDYYYYIDGEVKQLPVVEQETSVLSSQAQQAATLSKQAAEQGNIDLATKYLEMSAQFVSQTEDSSQKAKSDVATQAAEMAKAAALQAQATLEELRKITQAEGKIPSWIWIAVVAGAMLLFMKK